MSGKNYFGKEKSKLFKKYSVMFGIYLDKIKPRLGDKQYLTSSISTDKLYFTMECAVSQ